VPYGLEDVVALHNLEKDVQQQQTTIYLENDTENDHKNDNAQQSSNGNSNDNDDDNDSHGIGSSTSKTNEVSATNPTAPTPPPTAPTPTTLLVVSPRLATPSTLRGGSEFTLIVTPSPIHAPMLADPAAQYRSHYNGGSSGSNSGSGSGSGSGNNNSGSSSGSGSGSGNSGGNGSRPLLPPPTQLTTAPMGKLSLRAPSVEEKVSGSERVRVGAREGGWERARG
jgi:hypothetical protein